MAPRKKTVPVVSPRKRTEPSQPVILGGAYSAGKRVEYLEDDRAPNWKPPKVEE